MTHVGGRVTYRGDPQYEELVRTALSVSSDEEATRRHLHGFHSYPARLHPSTAHHLISNLSGVGQTVLDPFCGSGTVLLEASLLARECLGTDVNPLSVELVKFKTRPHSVADSDKWLAAAAGIAEFATARREERAKPIRLYAQAERAVFDPHMLLELDSLCAGIADLKDKRVRAALRLVLSSIVTKVSRRQGDSSGRVAPKRLAGGFAIRMFEDRTRELAIQCEEFRALLPQPPKCRAFEADARDLKPVKSRAVDLIVCSPPYPGVYDYFDHHAVRLKLLGLEGKRFQRSEIGSRRQLGRRADAASAWQRDLTQVLSACRRTLKSGSFLCAVMADVGLGSTLLRGDETMRRAAEANGMEFVGVGSQQRPIFHSLSAKAYRSSRRAEHLVLLRRT